MPALKTELKRFNPMSEVTPDNLTRACGSPCRPVLYKSKARASTAAKMVMTGFIATPALVDSGDTELLAGLELELELGLAVA